MKSILIPANRQTNKHIFCKCTPEIGNNEIRAGIPIKFNVLIDGINQIDPFKYSIAFDCNEWMISGSSTGFAKVKTYKFIKIHISCVGKLEIRYDSYIIWPVTIAYSFIPRCTFCPRFHKWFNYCCGLIKKLICTNALIY